MARIGQIKNKGLIITTAIILFITIALSVSLFFYFYLTSYGTNPKIDIDAKNVILLFTDEQSDILDAAPIKGGLKTRSISLSATDLAANATATASGVKVKNGNINYRFDKRLQNISDKLQDSNKRIGIISMDNATAAIPAAFTAHNKKISDSLGIANEQLTSSAFDLLIGIGDEYYKDLTVGNNTSYCQNYSQLLSASLNADKKIVGAINQAADADLLTLVTYGCTALQNQNGFLMVIDAPNASKKSVDATLNAMQTYITMHSGTVLIIVASKNYYFYGLGDADIQNKIDNTDIFNITYQLLS